MSGKQRRAYGAIARLRSGEEDDPAFEAELVDSFVPSFYGGIEQPGAASTAAPTSTAAPPSTAAPATSTALVDQSLTLQVTGSTPGPRTYRVRVPAGAGPFPLLLRLHGNGGTGSQLYNNDVSHASREQFVGVYPDGHQTSWNLGREAS